MLLKLDIQFKILFKGVFLDNMLNIQHPPRYYLHVDWERLSDTQVIVLLINKIIRLVWMVWSGLLVQKDYLLLPNLALWQIGNLALWRLDTLATW